MMSKRILTWMMQVLFKYICNFLNDTPFALDQESNLLCPNSFVKTTSLSVEGPPRLRSPLSGINKMASVIRDNYLMARDIRICQITTDIESYKGKKHSGGNRMKRGTMFFNIIQRNFIQYVME